MKRSDFIKLSCTGCLLGTSGLLAVTELISCSPAAKLTTFRAPVKDHLLEVPVSALTQPLTLVQGKGMDFDIAVHKSENGEYKALLLRCTHFSNPLTLTGDHFHCDLHGSEFDQTGKVTKGPAGKPLTSLPCKLENNLLTIHV